MRSYLYVPGDNNRFLEKAEKSMADAIILDLEDSVKHEAKVTAEDNLRNFVKKSNRKNLFLRPESSRISKIEDLLNHEKISRIVLPKADSVSSIDFLNAHNRSDKPIHALIESPTGLEALSDIAKGKNVVSLGIGEADFFGEISLAAHTNEGLKSYVRSKIVLVSAALKLQPPIAPVSSNFTDLAAFESETRDFLEMGFWGRTCIHPAQVEIVNTVFKVDQDLLRKAHFIIDAIRNNPEGASVDSDGKMIDAAHLRWAEKYIQAGCVENESEN
jgi:citrate lyase subunit beta/citryl-CoA lyase